MHRAPGLVLVIVLANGCATSVEGVPTTPSSGAGGAGSSDATSTTSNASGAGGAGASSSSSSASSTGVGPSASSTTASSASSASSSGQAGDGGACTPEVCNLLDDDCNGQCDDLLGCRVGVDRSYDGANGVHFYTTTDSEAACCGYAVETYDAFYLYAEAQAGLVPFYRCRTSTGTHLYTTDGSCDGATLEGTMGWIATGEVCGSVPLYHLHDTTSDDHLYTTSAAEAAAAESGGYVSEGTAGYVWPGACGGTSCTWPSPIDLVGSTTTSATGFPTAWYGFPIPAGSQAMTTLSGSVSVTNAASLYAEVLFILQYLPSGACPAGLLPASTPEYGPPGGQPLGQIIVKAPTQGTFTVPVSFTLPGTGVPMSSCVLLGLNGGSVSTAHDVTSSASLSLGYVAAASPTQTLLGAGGEFCFGQSWGCQAATTNNAQSFANVTPIAQAMHLLALYGDISDSTFDGTSDFGAPPTTAWTATNDFYVYHGAECAAFGVGSGTAGPGDYYASIPADAIHLLSVPLSGSAGVGVTAQSVYQSLASVPVAAGDCLVTLWGMQGGGGFDNETQVFALAAP